MIVTKRADEIQAGDRVPGYCTVTSVDVTHDGTGGGQVHIWHDQGDKPLVFAHDFPLAVRPWQDQACGGRWVAEIQLCPDCRQPATAHNNTAKAGS